MTARKRSVRYIAAEGAKNEDKSESGDNSESSDKNENSNTEGEQENNQVIWDRVWPGTREKAGKRSIRHTTVEGSMNKAKGALRSGKYKGEGAGRYKDKKSTAEPKKEDTTGRNKDEGAGHGEYLDTEGEQENDQVIWD